MIYLIGHLFWFLIFTAVLAGIAGAAWHRMHSQARIDAVTAERDRLMRDLVSAGVENSAGSAPSPELERQMDSHRLRADMAQARAAEADRAAESARARAEEATGRIAELERALERGGGGNAGVGTEELTRLREQVAAHEAQSRQVMDVEAAPAPPVEDEGAAQGWRLRYFEQRVRYLEEQARAAPPAPALAAADESAVRPLEWRARLAEARANHLERELRAAPAVAVSAPAAPAHDAEELRWRVSYLEKRLQYMGGQSEPAVSSEADNSAELAKWRARYLESRVRHLETQTASAPAAAPIAPIQTAAAPAHEEEDAPLPAPAPLVPAGAEERPPALPAAQSGAPDDLSLIAGVSLLQHSTLNALGIYHFDQIAAWTPANIAWVDQYLRLRGRIVGEDWVAQAARLVDEGPEAIRALEDERA